MKDHDLVAGINFCDRFLHSVHDVESDLLFCMFFFKSWFSLWGEVNSQNCVYWGAENPSFICELFLHDERIGVQ